MANLKSNVELWNLIRKTYPNFANHTAEGTADMFTESGFERIKQFDAAVLNDFFELSVRVWLNVVNISHAKDYLADNGFGEYYDQPWGGIIQRMAVDSIKPISPGYKGLENGDSPDPFVVRKPVTRERFWKQNFDYASLITMPDDFQYKQIFISEYGMSEYIAGIMEGLQNGYVIQVYTNKLEALDKAINSTADPLQDSQKVEVEMSATPTDVQLKDFILAVKNTITAMTMAPQSGAFNALKFKSTQDKGRLKLLVRAGYKNQLDVNTMVGAFNPEYLSLGVDIIEVSDFGGLEPYKEAEFTTRLYPVYSGLGELIGYNTVEGSKTVKVAEENVFWKDPNANVFAVLADKGVIFECRQNPYEVETIRNPRGKYTNYWASSPNNTIAYDPLYNMVIFKTA